MNCTATYMSYRGLTIWRWYDHLDGGPGKYGVIFSNSELSAMQGVKPGNVHPVCVVDDFGNLVKVQK